MKRYLIEKRGSTQEALLGDHIRMESLSAENSELDASNLPEPHARIQSLSCFILTVLGFSFWFLMAVPFASHRESYWWLAQVQTQGLAYAFTGISSTYRPLHQAATWFGFLILDPHVFPTNVLRQALLQVLMYGMFVLAWLLIYSAAAQRHLFALTAAVTGGAFFSGYLPLFHIYGNAYVPAMLTLGALLRFHASHTFDGREEWFAIAATLFVFWHPFTTALFVGFYFGYYLETFWQRSRAQHVRAVVILLVGMMAIAALVVIVPRLWTDTSAVLVQNALRPLGTKLFGFLVAYQTNEVNGVASLVAYLLAQMVVLSTGRSLRVKVAAFVFVSGLSVVFLMEGLPLLLIWLCAALIKLVLLHYWSLFFLLLTAALLPFGGGIGSPIHALFAIIIATFVTPLGWAQAERALAFVKPRYIIGTAIAAMVVLSMVRAGIEVPIVTRVANPLLAERERTYQLESILAWLHNSDYCRYEIAYVENANLPIDSVESAITRRNRPPAALEDVQLFWRTILQCQKAEHSAEHSNDMAPAAILTFGGPALADAKPVFKVDGRYGGDAAVWIRDSQKH
jgi:hypothetical protein